jgi:ATP synthase protein I
VSKKNNYPNYIKYSGLGFQILVTVLIGVFAGQWLDKHFHVKNNLFTILLSLIMIIVAMIQVIIKFRE